MENTVSVLIVDDDIEIRELLKGYFSDFHIRSEIAPDGPAMRMAVESNHFDVILLDLMLPGEDGLSLCRHLRNTTTTPIIMMTARGEPIDKVIGLEMGADDYIVKPFEPRELVARIRSIVRRSKTNEKTDNAGTESSDHIGFEGWRLNRVSRQLISPQQIIIPLSNAEFRLLWVFIERPRRVLSRDQLMDAARGQLANAFDRSIDLLVSRIRQKLNEDPRHPKLLKTIRGEGYMLDVQVVR
ncbi:MAG: response regulator [Burkholderiaceae bacterium]